MSEPTSLATTQSTDGTATVSPLEQCYELSPDVSLRRDHLGIRFYDHRTRHLRHVRSGELSQLIEALLSGMTLGSALDEVCRDAERRASLLGALSELSAAGVLRGRT